MADNPRSATPAWQDPHLKDRGDYTEQDIQNVQEKGGILPDFTLDEAEETHLFARAAQALSKTLTRQGLTVRHECFASMFVRQVRQCFSAVWADGFPRCRHRFPVM